MKPYVYVATGKSRDVQREAPTGARVAVHYPELGRTVELETNARGLWAVSERPAPGHGGEVVEIATGDLQGEGAKTIARDAVSRALNSACDEIIAAGDLPDEGMRDALNLLVNAGMHYLDHPGDSLSDVIAANYDDSEGTPLEWITRA
jgi:hypothetical protein